MRRTSEKGWFSIGGRHPAIPRVLCPQCVELMRLAQIARVSATDENMQFDCGCGFEYRIASGPTGEAARGAAN